LETGIERFQYQEDYKRKLPTAAIEERVTLRAEYEKDSTTAILTGVWVGARNIGSYANYNEHYNIDQGVFGVQDIKRQRSPSFWVWNASVRQKIRHVDVTIGIDNIFNYTQARRGDSPAMWHLHGNHTHFDNLHVWGPNRGREVYLRLSTLF
jgi:outer membrane receptor protein involved in Fe transport